MGECNSFLANLSGKILLLTYSGTALCPRPMGSHFTHSLGNLLLNFVPMNLFVLSVCTNGMSFLVEQTHAAAVSAPRIVALRMPHCTTRSEVRDKSG